MNSKTLYVPFIFIFFNLIAVNIYSQFAKGADVGWLSEMEASGKVFYNDDGEEQDVLEILADHCMNSIRLRVWVDPEDGYCGKKDVATMAKRASDMGFRIMIDFHYSDSWADPSQQTKPEAWENYSESELEQAIYDHTYDVLDTLNQLGVTPEWVQIGNETNNGMLWEDGKASLYMSTYAAFVTSGNNAAKAVFPDIITIVHLSNGYDNDMYVWNIGGLIDDGAQFDAIGMSLYPDPDEWEDLTSDCLTNMEDMVSRYDKPVIISEIGMSYTSPDEAKLFVEDIVEKNESLGDYGLGVFWWEPECYDWNSYDKGAWGTDGKPTVALDGFLTNCSVEVTFTVDMEDADTTNGVYITGEMTSDGTNWTIVEMDYIGNHTYAATFSIANGEEGGYYYLNDDDWDARETVPGECIGIYGSDRLYSIPASDTTYYDTWASCDVNIDCNGVYNGTAYYDNCSNCVGGTTGLDSCVAYTEEIMVGWNLISFPYLPVNNDAATLFSEAVSVKNSDKYYYSGQYDFLNTLSEITVGDAYLVYADSEFEINFYGNEVDVASSSLKEGWNMVGVPYNESFSTDDLPSQVLTVKDFNGFYEPEDEQSTLLILEPGKGYFIKVSSDCVIYW